MLEIVENIIKNTKDILKGASAYQTTKEEPFIRIVRNKGKYQILLLKERIITSLKYEEQSKWFKLDEYAYVESKKVSWYNQKNSNRSKRVNKSHQLKLLIYIEKYIMREKLIEC